jgi:hypothetical protein
MKRNQKKYTKKNYKGGVLDKNMSQMSLAAIKKRLDNIELELGTVKTKMGEINTVEGVSREDNTGFEEAGFKEQEIPLQNNPMNPDFVSNPSTSGKQYNGSTPILDTQYAEVDSLNEKIKSLSNDKKNKAKLQQLNSLKNALFAKYQKRVDYLEQEAIARTLTQDENDELRNLKANLDPNEPLGGGRKSRRYRKSRKGKRTRKYKK